jgi:diguanylate cyclase (GGDEF)-like protein
MAVVAVAAGGLGGIAALAAAGAVVAAACGVATWRSARRLEAWLGEQLHGSARDLDRSRQAFRRAIARLGETLAATHDRAKILEAVSETAQLAVGGQRGIFFEYVPARKVLVARSGVGPDAPELTLPLGTGLAGSSAANRTAIRYPGEVAPIFPEPEVETALAVPFSSRGQFLGVVAVYGHGAGQTFGQDDVEALITLVAQATTAVDNVSLHEEAQRLSITDGLTGLWNRRQLDLRCQEELERAIRFGRPVGLVFCDVDHFKDVNTEWHHQGGDAVLVEVARRLAAATREIDVVARYGGEEFVLLLPETDLAGSRVLAEKVRRAMCESPVEHAGRSRTVTLSLGVAAYPHSGTSVRTLLAAAQEALGRAKANGRNRIEEAQPKMRSTG